jgi:hypothetical protein
MIAAVVRELGRTSMAAVSFRCAAIEPIEAISDFIGGENA